MKFSISAREQRPFPLGSAYLNATLDSWTEDGLVSLRTRWLWVCACAAFYLAQLFGLLDFFQLIHELLLML